MIKWALDQHEQRCRWLHVWPAVSVFGAVLLVVMIWVWLGAHPQTVWAQTGPPCETVSITTSAPGIHSGPAVSADGSRIAFWSTGNMDSNRDNADGSIEVFLYDAATRRYTQITESAGSILGGFNLEPSISADGGRVAFFSDRHLDDMGDNLDGNFEIFVYDASANDIIQVTQTTRGVNISPAICGGGGAIAFASDRNLDPDVGNADGNLEIFVAKVGTGITNSVTITQITQTGAGVINDRPAISDCGERISFVSNGDLDSDVDNSDGNVEIFVYDAAAAADPFIQVTNTPLGVFNDQPSINSRGSHVAFVSDIDNNYEVYLYDADADPVDRVTQVTNTPFGVINDQPQINVDGTLIAFVSDRNGSFESFLYDRLTGVATSFPNTEGSAHPAISPFGDRIAYTVNREIRMVQCSLVDLAIVKIPSSAPVPPSAPLTYTLVITNNGPSTAVGVMLSDTLPTDQILPALRPRDQTDDDNSALGFGGGSHNGTTSASGALVATGYVWQLPGGATPSGWVSMTGNVLLMHMNENPALGGSIIFDASGQGNNGVLVTSLFDFVNKSTSGRLGTALQFDGLDDYLEVPHNVSMNVSQELTMMAWVKLLNPAINQKIVGKTPIGSGFLLGVNAGRLYPEIWDSAGLNHTFQAGNIPLNTWTHLAVTWRTGDDMIGYINGTEVGRTPAGANPIGANFNPLRIGAAPWNPSVFNTSGAIDEVAVFSRALSPQEISLVHERQSVALSGFFDSRRLDSDRDYDPAWNSISWTSPRPIYKELPNNGGSDTGYATGIVTMSQNALLMHLNDTPAISGTIIADTSGLGRNGTLVTSELTPVDKSAAGRFHTALRLDGLNDHVDVPIDVSESAYAVSLWFKTNCPSCGIFSVDSGTLGSGGHDRHIYLSGGDLCTRVWQWFSSETICSAGGTFADGNWHHVVHTFGGVVGGQRIYVDGALWNSGAMSRSDFNWQTGLNIGFSNDAIVDFLDGSIDEVAVFDKALGPQEVANLHKRGGLRLKFQVRTCDTGSCAGQSFVGPDGTAGSFYSELNNPAAAPPALLLSNLSTRRYFQYRAYLESDNLGESPTLERVIIGKTHYENGTVNLSPGNICNGTLTCTLGSITPGTRETVEIAFVVGGVSTQTVVSNAAWVTNTVYERAASNNSDSVDVGVTTADFSQSDYQVGESAGQTTITVTLRGDAGLPVTVDYATSDMTAEAGSDYLTATGTLTFNPGVAIQTFTVDILPDALYEGVVDERVQLTLSNSTNAIIGGNNPAILAIEDDDVEPSVEFSNAGQSRGEDVGTMTVTVQLSAASGLDVTVPFTTTGTATEGVADDYTITPSPIVIPAGSLANSILITVNDDAVDENDETVRLSMGTPTNATLGATIVHTAIITDNDSAAVNVTPTSVNVAEELTTSAVYTVSLTSEPTRRVDISVFYDSAQVTVTPDTFSFNSGGNWDRLQPVTVTAVDDSLDEIDPHQRIITHTAGSNDPNYDNIAIDDVTAFIRDNDDPPAVDFDSATQSRGEGVGTMVATVQLSAVSTLNVTVPFVTTGTATQGGGADYTITSSPLVIPAGSPSADIVITVNDDAVSESDETVIVTLGAPTNGTLGTVTVHTATITDNDGAGVSVTPLSVNVAEELETSDVYSVSLDSQPTDVVTVTISYDALQVTVTPTTLNFDQVTWNAPQGVTVTALDDNVDEADPHQSTISHAATSNDSNYQGIAIFDVTATIADNDFAVSSVSIAGSTGGPIGQSFTFTATVLPSMASLPISYLWEATEQVSETHAVNRISDTQTFTWSTNGTKAITVTATNAFGGASDTLIFNATTAQLLASPHLAEGLSPWLLERLAASVLSLRSSVRTRGWVLTLATRRKAFTLTSELPSGDRLSVRGPPPGADNSPGISTW